MHENDYLIMGSSCEVNGREKLIKKKGNDRMNACDPLFELDLKETKEADVEGLPCAEEVAMKPNHQKRIGDRTIFPQCNSLKFNRYGDSFSGVMELVVGPDERMISNDIDLMDKRNNDCVEDQSESEIEFEQVVEQTHENEKKNEPEGAWMILISSL